jgi:hypothetical protein
MKSKPPKSAVSPVAAFPDPKRPPEPAELATTLGRAFGPLSKVTEAIRAAQPSVTVEWKFSPRSGWYQIYVLNKRRLFYLIPKSGDYYLSLILGDKALALLKQGAFAAEVGLLLKDAKRYPEGTAFRFERKAFNPRLVLALLAAKISPEPKRRSFV